MSVHISSPEGDPSSSSVASRPAAGGAALGARPKLTREGVLLGGTLVPLLSGSVHYFRLEPDSWRACLEAMREMGCTVVDVYVPWSVPSAEAPLSPMT